MTTDEMEIRPLSTWEEYRACEELQREVWGQEFTELAPASLLKIGQRIGGVSSGAFHGGDGLVGFVFGLTGLEEGRPVHWSHMLAVRRGFRDRGLGLRLKEHQRDRLLDRGVERVYWTFDPLVARNAHFNLERLGVRVLEYVEDMYGETGSRLHRGLGTDRFVVAWDLPAYAPPDSRDAAPRRREAAAADRVAVEIPADIHRIREDDPEAAARWRRESRRSFLRLLEEGYRVTGFRRPDGEETGRYVLER